MHHTPCLEAWQATPRKPSGGDIEHSVLNSLFIHINTFFYIYVFICKCVFMRSREVPQEIKFPVNDSDYEKEIQDSIPSLYHLC